jgi:hypothetical protein
MTDKDKIAALEARVAELEAKAKPPEPEKPFVPMTDAEHQNWAHQLREGRMKYATPPSVIRDWAVIPEHIVRGIVNDRHAPTGPSSQGAIPSSQRVENVRTGGSTTPGYVDPRPLSNPPGTNWVDAQCIADEVRQRAERMKGR